ncbi:hypothetical protein PENANT_c073G02679 [Penicillium antarcticum]|uniref:Uncharacterized protein n=1 Tax=Penicillium antarcticum TaxID=416450 RepID=A0A1V6PPP8_9EURO|nr:hypothetical protein PENANT_c073G02679 [Penicillium antarcticum]
MDTLNGFSRRSTSTRYPS